MTQKNILVLDGNQIKARLQFNAAKRSSFVHVDWLRMTFNMRFLPVPRVDFLFPQVARDNVQDCYFGKQGYEELQNVMLPQLKDLQEQEKVPGAYAWELAEQIASFLGPEFSVDVQVKPGRDFYKYRYSILRNSHKVGWVGFLAAAKGKYKDQQAKTVHVNLEGMACTFARDGWLLQVADYLDEYRGTITRCDFALDLFSGIRGGFERLKEDYISGKMDHLGRRPKCKAWDEWDDQNEGRSVYLGSRQAGKITNIYEKGKQLFGSKDASDWWRVELRYGNQLRVLPSDILRNPADVFAGASEWHAQLLAEHKEWHAGQRIKCKERLETQTIEAEVTRNVRWFLDNAAASAMLALRYAPQKLLDELFFDEGLPLPNRLRKFDRDEVKTAFASCFESVTGRKRAAGLLTA